MKFKVKDLKPSPFRNFDDSPLDRTKVDLLKQSIEETGFWENVLVRTNKTEMNPKGEAQLTQGHSRMQAVREMFGEDYEVDLPTKELNDDDMFRVLFEENNPIYNKGGKVDINAFDAVIKKLWERLNSTYFLKNMYSVSEKRKDREYTILYFHGLPIPKHHRDDSENGFHHSCISKQVQNWIGKNWIEQHINESLTRLRMEGRIKWAEPKEDELEEFDLIYCCDSKDICQGFLKIDNMWKEFVKGKETTEEEFEWIYCCDNRNVCQLFLQVDDMREEVEAEEKKILCKEAVELMTTLAAARTFTTIIDNIYHGKELGAKRSEKREINIEGVVLQKWENKIVPDKVQIKIARSIRSNAEVNDKRAYQRPYMEVEFVKELDGEDEGEKLEHAHFKVTVYNVVDDVGKLSKKFKSINTQVEEKKKDSKWRDCFGSALGEFKFELVLRELALEVGKFYGFVRNQEIKETGAKEVNLLTGGDIEDVDT